jgi:hypothetical protein
LRSISAVEAGHEGEVAVVGSLHQMALVAETADRFVQWSELENTLTGALSRLLGTLEKGTSLTVRSTRTQALPGGLRGIAGHGVSGNRRRSGSAAPAWHRRLWRSSRSDLFHLQYAGPLRCLACRWARVARDLSRPFTGKDRPRANHPAFAQRIQASERGAWRLPR